jgi:hypothetical protein
MFSTYTRGGTLKVQQNITKGNIATMCHLLSNHKAYVNICEFAPEPITEGGIVYKFNETDTNNKWYKTVRFHYFPGESQYTWPRIGMDVMEQWNENSDVLFSKNNKIELFLKSFHGAPVFTQDELKIWEECFNQIGMKRIGRYPGKKRLITSLI